MPRKLAAILSADVKGYSRMMADDEEATVRTLTAYRQVMAQLVERHHGRVVDAPGDNLLAEFPSAVSAVACAVAIQQRLAVENQPLPPVRRMEFRIGINLGDVIDEQGRLYGDGVNVAARIEGLAAPGGVSVSASIHEQVKNKLDLTFVEQGRHKVKNIAEPVRVFQVLPAKAPAVRLRSRLALLPLALALAMVAAGAWGLWRYHSTPPAPEKTVPATAALPLPDKPSIAVLPFDNLGGQAGQQYIADGISDSIITALAKIPQMLVIARNSSFTYRGKAVKVRQVARELGVRYVLEGSVLESGDRLRVTAQLIDAASGHHLWAETYDRPMGDLFRVMDDITKNIALALQIRLTEGEQAHLRHSAANLKAWLEATKGLDIFLRYSKEGMDASRRLFQRAVELDPNYAFAWTMLASTYVVDARYGYSSNPMESLEKGLELALKSEALDPNQPLVHSVLGIVYLVQHKYGQALAEGEKAVALGPNETDALALHAITLIFTGHPQRAAALCRKAIRLHPLGPAYFYYLLAWALRDSGRLAESEAVYHEILVRDLSGPQELRARCNRVILYMEQGREQKARQEARDILAKYPQVTVRWLLQGMPYQDPAVAKRLASLWRQAGLPEGEAAPAR